MSSKRKVIIAISLVALLLAGFGALAVLWGPRSFVAGFDRGMHARYEKISVGESRKQVFDALGQPRARSDVFNLPQKHGFEHFFEAAENSSAVEYCQWINGMNWYYCIGFDASGSVVIKGEGHS